MLWFVQDFAAGSNIVFLTENFSRVQVLKFKINNIVLQDILQNAT